MLEKTDKRARAQLFRQRLHEMMAYKSVSQTALADRVGVDRSTISQLLRDEGARLPNAQIVAECAAALGVSADWLLGLSERSETAANVLAQSLSSTKAPRALVDEQIFAWHKEAEGYKIRHVPAALPDMLKTRALLEWEYEPHLGRSTDQAIGASTDRLNWMRSAHSDYEIAFPIYELTSFAAGEGYYKGLPIALRTEQLRYLQEMSVTLYPRLRVYLYDARRVFSAPITIFGPLQAVLYVGQTYLAFRDRERVRSLTDQFDHLVREAEITARDLPEYLGELILATDTGFRQPFD